MKVLLLCVSLWLGGAVADSGPAPYPASGWRPNGPSFELPEKQTAPRDSYLPANDDETLTPQYGAPEDDLSVQGLPARGAESQYAGFQGKQAAQQFPRDQSQSALKQGVPVQEPTPLFLVTPLNGQQYIGSSFNADLQVLQDQLKQLQDQRQQSANFEKQQNSQTNPDEYNVQLRFNSQNTKKAFGETTPQDFKDDRNSNSFDAPATKPNNFGNTNQFQPTASDSFGQSSTVKPNETSFTDFNNVNATKTDVNNDDLVKNNNDKVVEYQKSLSYQLPDNYPNQLAQLALQNQLGSVPFSQQIGQLQLPIIYQPAQAYTQRLIQPQFSNQFQNFNPNNPINFPAVDHAASQRQTSQKDQVNSERKSSDSQKDVNSQNQFNSNANDKVNENQRNVNPDQQRFDDKLNQYPQSNEGSSYQNDNSQGSQSFSRQRFYPGQADANANQVGSFQSGFSINQQQNKQEPAENNDQDYDLAAPIPVSSGLGERTPSSTRYGAPQPRTQSNNGYATENDSQAPQSAEGRRRKSSRLRNIRPLFTLDAAGQLVQLQ